jgi:hypothetical protein
VQEKDGQKNYSWLQEPQELWILCFSIEENSFLGESSIHLCLWLAGFVSLSSFANLILLAF